MSDVTVQLINLHMIHLDVHVFSATFYGLLRTHVLGCKAFDWLTFYDGVHYLMMMIN